MLTDWKVLGAYLAVVILHGLWDGLPGFISAVLSPGLDVFIGQAAVGGTGLFILWRRWREAKRLAIGQADLSEAAEATEQI